MPEVLTSVFAVRIRSAALEKKFQDFCHLHGVEILGVGANRSTLLALAEAHLRAQTHIWETSENNLLAMCQKVRAEREQRAAQAGEPEPDLVLPGALWDDKFDRIENPFVAREVDAVHAARAAEDAVEKAHRCDPDDDDDDDDSDLPDTDTYDDPDVPVTVDPPGGND